METEILWDLFGSLKLLSKNTYRQLNDNAVYAVQIGKCQQTWKSARHLNRIEGLYRVLELLLFAIDFREREISEDVKTNLTVNVCMGAATATRIQRAIYIKGQSTKKTPTKSLDMWSLAVVATLRALQQRQVEVIFNSKQDPMDLEEQQQTFLTKVDHFTKGLVKDAPTGLMAQPFPLHQFKEGIFMCRLAEGDMVPVPLPYCTTINDALVENSIREWKNANASRPDTDSVERLAPFLKSGTPSCPNFTVDTHRPCFPAE